MSSFYLGRIDEVEYQIQNYPLSFKNCIFFQEHNFHANIFFNSFFKTLISYQNAIYNRELSTLSDNFNKYVNISKISVS